MTQLAKGYDASYMNIFLPACMFLYMSNLFLNNENNSTGPMNWSSLMEEAITEVLSFPVDFRLPLH